MEPFENLRSNNPQSPKQNETRNMTEVSFRVSFISLALTRSIRSEFFEYISVQSAGGGKCNSEHRCRLPGS